MNTMYRNESKGYQNVTEKFNGHGPEILMDNYNLQTKLSGDLKSNYTETEQQVKEKLESLKTAVNKEITGEMLFSEVKESKNEAYQTLLNKFHEMPKGGLLHVHSTVGLDADNLLEMLVEWNRDAKTEGMEIYYSQDEILYDAMGETKTIPEKTLMFKKQFDSISAKNIIKVEDGTKNELKNYIIFSKKGNWSEFNNIFCRTKALFECKEFYGSYHKKFFEECVKNKIFYVEIRTGFQEFTVSDKESDTLEGIRKGIIFLRPGFKAEDFFYHENMMTDTNPAVPDIEFLKQIKQAMDSVNICDTKLEVKVILTANRNTKTDTEEINNVLRKMDAAITIKNIYNDDVPEIVGFDLVSEEKNEIGTTDSFSQFIYSNFGSGYVMPSSGEEMPEKISSLKENLRIRLIRFFLHDGESVEKIENYKDNAITGPICSRHRIGHGFKMGIDVLNFNDTTDPGNREKGTLIKDYILSGCSADVGDIVNYPIKLEGEKYCREDKIAEPVIEFCPISNQLLGYTRNLNEHPAGNLIKKGIFAVVSNDDPQIFDNPGLSYDYLMAFISGILDYEQIKISVFLGYFYREMSNSYYYKDDERGIYVVNDKMTFCEEAEIISVAIEKFKTDWNRFICSFSISS